MAVRQVDGFIEISKPEVLQRIDALSCDRRVVQRAHEFFRGHPGAISAREMAGIARALGYVDEAGEAHVRDHWGGGMFGDIMPRVTEVFRGAVELLYERPERRVSAWWVRGVVPNFALELIPAGDELGLFILTRHLSPREQELLGTGPRTAK